MWSNDTEAFSVTKSVRKFLPERGRDIDLRRGLTPKEGGSGTKRTRFIVRGKHSNLDLICSLKNAGTCTASGTTWYLVVFFCFAHMIGGPDYYSKGLPISVLPSEPSYNGRQESHGTAHSVILIPHP